ncbi:MAG TPA: phage terminase small subunit [Sphingomonadaceae bacterium]|nr:phage terminase small subunit [Sphingomonadaceae bacterium]
MSVVRNHRQRILAAKAAGDAPAGIASHSGRAAGEYDLMRARLGNDLRRLHDIQSVEGKIELKRELLPAYAAWVEGVLKGMFETGRGIDDEILPVIMVWRIDTGDFRDAMPLAAAMLRFGLSLPERYKRTPATLIAEEIADAALKVLGSDQDFDLEILLGVDLLVKDQDIFDEVRAKLEAAIGRQLARQARALDDDADGPAGGKRATLDAAIARLTRARPQRACRRQEGTRRPQARGRPPRGGRPRIGRGLTPGSPARPPALGGGKHPARRLRPDRAWRSPHPRIPGGEPTEAL